MRGLLNILSLFRNEFNKFTRAQILESILYDIGIITLISHFCPQKEELKFCHLYATLLWTSFHTCNVTPKSVNHYWDQTCFSMH